MTMKAALVKRLRRPGNSSLRRPRYSGAGFSLVELMLVVTLIGLMVLFSAVQSRRQREAAVLHSCIAYHVALNQTLWGEVANNGDFPTSFSVILDQMPPAGIAVEFDYVGGQDLDAGHGNDKDGNDGDNPGTGVAGDDVGYYIRCAHDHSYLKVLFVDSAAQLPPKAIYDLADARGTIPEGTQRNR